MVELNKSHYAFEMSQILEITTKVKITRVPNSKPFIHGIANLRGKIVPMINLKRLLGFQDIDTGSGCYVFFRLEEPRNLLIGSRVDSIFQTIVLDPEKIRDVPYFENQTDCKFVKALYAESNFSKPIAILDLTNALQVAENEIQNTHQSSKVI
ncbi:MAG: chemotaxis protein CheW [Deltaproteobacteria bacterium]|nr:chemotaxis protein CheW [Deltaproteobacteria bacterium]